MQKNIKRHKIKTLRSIHLVLFSIIIIALINKFIKQFYVDKRKLDLLKVEFYKVFNLNPYGKSGKTKTFYLYELPYFGRNAVGGVVPITAVADRNCCGIAVNNRVGKMIDD